MARATGAANALLVCPGWDDHGRPQFEKLRSDLAGLGWTCRRADLPDADWSEEARAGVVLHDGLAQLVRDHDALRAQAGMQDARMAVLGFSYGGYMAAQLTALRPVELLILRSPALYPDAVWHTKKVDIDEAALDAFRRQPHAPPENRALACCAAFRGDVLLIGSENDEVIPPEVIRSYRDAFSAARSLTTFTIPGADHPLTAEAWKAAYHCRVVDWLQHMRAA